MRVHLRVLSIPEDQLHDIGSSLLIIDTPKENLNAPPLAMFNEILHCAPTLGGLRKQKGLLETEDIAQMVVLAWNTKKVLGSVFRKLEAEWGSKSRLGRCFSW